MMTDNPDPIIHVWITKQAMRHGIVECDAVYCMRHADCVIRQTAKKVFQHYCKPHWHTELPSARARVREMIAAKVKNLKASLAKMDKLAQEYKD